MNCYEAFVDELEEKKYNIEDLEIAAKAYYEAGRYDEVVAYYMVKEKS